MRYILNYISCLLICTSLLGVQVASSYALINDLVIELPDGGEENQTEENVDTEIEFESDKLLNNIDDLSDQNVNKYLAFGIYKLHSSSNLEIPFPPPDFS